jgi:sugar phosphate isomerase/epimerase
MRYGVCAGIEKAPLLFDAGYDYIELSVAGDLIPDDDDAAWATKRAAIRAMPLVAEAFNSFVRTGKIVGPEADRDRLRRYVDTALSRAAEVGGRIIVFGSGGARQIPDGWPAETAGRQLIDFLHLCADASASTGVAVVIEPLCRVECNVLNTVAEGAALARTIGRAGVANLADTYHMAQNGESVDEIAAHADVLAHVHTATAPRRAPGTDDTDFVAIFRALRQAGYDGRVSIECGWGDMATEAPGALTTLRAAHAAAK